MILDENYFRYRIGSFAPIPFRAGSAQWAAIEIIDKETTDRCRIFLYVLGEHRIKIDEIKANVPGFSSFSRLEKNSLSILFDGFVGSGFTSDSTIHSFHTAIKVVLPSVLLTLRSKGVPIDNFLTSDSFSKDIAAIMKAM